MPQVGVYTEVDADADIATHAALTDTHGVTTAIADTDDIDTHAALPTVHQDAPALILTHAADYGLHTNVVRKTADQTVNNTTTLVDVTEMLQAIAANEIWIVRFIIFGNSGSTPDFKFTVTAPSGATGAILHIRLGETPYFSAFATTTAYPAYTVDYVEGELIALVINGATAGNIQLQFAQQVADASDSKVLAGTCKIATQLV